MTESIERADKGMKHFFVHDGSNFPVGCIASLRAEGETKISYAVAVCNPLDNKNYQAERARTMATRRLKKFVAGGYKGHHPPPTLEGAKTKPPDFEGHKYGAFELQPSVTMDVPAVKPRRSVSTGSPKIQLLAHLKRDGHLPSRLRKAISHEIRVLIDKIEQRVKAAQANASKN